MIKSLSLLIMSLIALPLLANEKPVKKALFMIPGALVKPASYEELIETIVKRLDADVSIRYAEFFGDFPNLESSSEQLESFFADIQAEGFKPSITVIGHSLGGLGLSDLPKAYYEKIVLMASYVQADWIKYANLNTNKPVLSIGGSLDTQTYVQRIAFDANRFKDKQNFYPVILDGLSHFQFADGHKDNKAYPQGLSDEDARALISEIVSSFIKGDINSIKSEPYMLRSRELLEGYLSSFDADQTICYKAQLGHLGIEDTKDIGIELTSYDKKRDYPRFILDKSYINLTDGKPQIGVYQYSEYGVTPIDVPVLQSVTPELIACKLRSSQAVSAFMGRKYKGRSCAEENLEVLKHAYQKLPFFRTERLSKKGFSLLDETISATVSDDKELIEGAGFLITDTFKSRGDQWALGSYFSANPVDGVLTIETFSVTTPSGNPDNKFLGAHYCKVLAPSRAFQILDELSRN